MGEVEYQSLKGNVGVVARTFTRLLNMLIVIGAIATILLLFIIRPLPTFVGVGFLLLSCLNVISGLFGAMATGQNDCFSLHILALLLSSTGLAATFLLIFLRFQAVAWALNPTAMNPYRVQLLARIVGAVAFVLFTSQLVVLLLSCMLNLCRLVDHNEDLAAVKEARQRLRLERARDKKAALSEPVAHKATERLREKYKQWMSPAGGHGRSAMYGSKENERPGDVEALFVGGNMYSPRSDEF